MRVLIVGLGSIASKHIASLRQLDEKVYVDALRSSKNSIHWDGIRDLFDWGEVDSGSYDFAIVSNPTSSHKETLSRLLKLRVPIFLEKPLYNKLDIKDIVNDFSRAGIITYVACDLRFLKSLIFTKSFLENNCPRINEVNIYCGSYLPDWRKNIDFRKNYSAIPELGGGVHLDLIHELDYTYWFWGIPENNRSYFSNRSSLGILAYDYANYCLSYPSFNVNVVLNYYRRDPKRVCEIVCEYYTILVDIIKDTVRIDNKIVFESNKNTDYTYLEEMKYFVSCVQRKLKTLNTIEDSYNVLKICLGYDFKK